MPLMFCYAVRPAVTQLQRYWRYLRSMLEFSRRQSWCKCFRWKCKSFFSFFLFIFVFDFSSMTEMFLFAGVRSRSAKVTDLFAIFFSYDVYRMFFKLDALDVWWETKYKFFCMDVLSFLQHHLSSASCSIISTLCLLTKAEKNHQGIFSRIHSI